MASWTFPSSGSTSDDDRQFEPRLSEVLAVTAFALAFVLATRWPVAREIPLETDEFGFLEDVTVRWFPMHHTLFKTLARVVGLAMGDFYRGFILIDMMTSAVALVGVWWWLRALVRPPTAAAATLMLGVGPVFWGYGAIAGNYTAIVAVGSFLMGVALRGHHRPEPWHPFAAAVALALGTGYRTDLGVLWLPVLLVILWQHRWKRAVLAGIAFVAVNLAWAGAMIAECGGWERYRAATAEFAHSAGALNSYWNLGVIDGPVRYAVKLVMAVVWTFGPALFVVPRGIARLRRHNSGGFLAFLVMLSVTPALAFHLLIHFGVPGYGLHYVPALIALIVLGVGLEPRNLSESVAPREGRGSLPRLLGLAAVLAAAFWLYPTDYSAPGWRGDFDLSFCRFTRHGLNTPAPRPQPYLWRTANSPRTAFTSP
jgi:hypothetical protein